MMVFNKSWKCHREADLLDSLSYVKGHRGYLRPMPPNSLWLLVDLVRSRRPLKDYIQYSPTAQFDLDILYI